MLANPCPTSTYNYRKTSPIFPLKLAFYGNTNRGVLRPKSITSFPKIAAFPHAPFPRCQPPSNSLRPLISPTAIPASRPTGSLAPYGKGHIPAFPNMPKTKPTPHLFPYSARKAPLPPSTAGRPGLNLLLAPGSTRAGPPPSRPGTSFRLPAQTTYRVLTRPFHRTSGCRNAQSLSPVGPDKPQFKLPDAQSVVNPPPPRIFLRQHAPAPLYLHPRPANWPASSAT